MRRFLVILPLLLGLSGLTQYKSFIISVKGDTLNRVDQKNHRQGPWVIHMDELRGEEGYDEQGYYLNDKKDGAWVRFSLMGDKIAEENYRWGVLDGKAHYYNRTGALEREESWRAVDPEKTMDTVAVMDIKDPTKVIDHVIVKVEGQTNKHGIWTYYDPEWGTVIKTERYFLGKLQTDDQASASGDDDLKPLAVSDNSKAKNDSLAKKKPQVILDYEKKNTGKKKIKVRDGQTGF